MVIVGNWYIRLDGKSMLGGRNGAHAGTKFIHRFLHSLNSVEHLTVAIVWCEDWENAVVSPNVTGETERTTI